jgi:hypothetical protein
LNWSMVAANSGLARIFSMRGNGFFALYFKWNCLVLWPKALVYGHSQITDANPCKIRGFHSPFREGFLATGGSAAGRPLCKGVHARPANIADAACGHA